MAASLSHARMRKELNECTRIGGFRRERDVFSILRSDDHVVRSFEGAVVDGAIDCSSSYSGIHSYAKRFWRCVDQQKSRRTQLLPFDVKSSAEFDADEQTFLGTVIQHRITAFWVLVCSADPKWAEVVPNFRQVPPSEWGLRTRCRDDRRLQNVLPGQTSYAHPSTYILNPTGSPYRLPISHLPEAFARIRRCVDQGIPYVNPWTHVCFDDWIPHTTHDADCLIPSEISLSYPSFKAIQEMARVINHAKVPGAEQLHLEFVGSQPLIGDFKLMVEQSSAVRQHFVQHKLHTINSSSAVGAVPRFPIARKKEDGSIEYYFRRTARFNFFCYQLVAEDYDEILFFPESIVPDSFYTTHDMTADFNIAPFNERDHTGQARYRFRKDASGGWVHRVMALLQSSAPATGSHERPARISLEQASSKSRTGQAGRLPGQRPQNPSPATGDSALPGRTAFERINRGRFRSFWWHMMEQCAIRRSDLMLILPNDHPLGDILYCPYAWTVAEQEAFLQHGRVPATIDDMLPLTPVIALLYYAREARADFYGPPISDVQFERLDSTSLSRLIVLDVLELTRKDSRPLFLIPSADIAPTAKQREEMTANIGGQRTGKRPTKTPLLAHLLESGKWPSDYRIGNNGALLYEEQSVDWAKIWTLCHEILMQHPVEHPEGTMLFTPEYRHHLQQVHQMYYEMRHRPVLGQPQWPEDSTVHDQARDVIYAR